MSNPSRHKTDHAHKASKGFADGGTYYDRFKGESDRQRQGAPQGLAGVRVAQDDMRRRAELGNKAEDTDNRTGGRQYNKLRGEARRQGWVPSGPDNNTNGMFQSGMTPPDEERKGTFLDKDGNLITRKRGGRV